MHTQLVSVLLHRLGVSFKDKMFKCYTYLAVNIPFHLILLNVPLRLYYCMFASLSLVYTNLIQLFSRSTASLRQNSARIDVLKI